MKNDGDAVSTLAPQPAVVRLAGVLTAMPLRQVARASLKDTFAGLMAAVVLVANIVSFGALMFPGALGAGIPVAIWAMLIGSCVGGAWIALSTSLPPLATGIDSPTARLSCC